MKYILLLLLLATVGLCQTKHTEPPVCTLLTVGDTVMIVSNNIAFSQWFIYVGVTLDNVDVFKVISRHKTIPKFWVGDQEAVYCILHDGEWYDDYEGLEQARGKK